MVKENLTLCLKKIEAAAGRSGRDANGIILVVVTKGVEAGRIREALDNGVVHIGENRLQEALLKYKQLEEYARGKGQKLFWHMVGHLQRNKARDAVRIFDLIHSVDSIALAVEIDKQAARINKKQDILLEVKTSPEATKSGFSPEDVFGAVKEMVSLNHVNIKGLMTVAPLVDKAEEARPYFRQLKELSEELFVHGPWSMVHGPILSMGMTDDFQVAIEEGATMVRIGRGIFGERR